MLQRAASNAYSWWWASHVRTKQSKWLEQNLLDIEEKVQEMLKLLEEEGDSFAKRAEMYYKKRPELIQFVKESLLAYRALAERYDHMSTELQNANSTIASVFPERFQYETDDEDDDDPPPRPRRNVPQACTNNVPAVPKYPSRDLKGIFTSASKKLQANKWSKESSNAKNARPKSGLTKSEALQEIDKLQKEILALQTAKEFVKSSYESGLVRYEEIENQIEERQERVFSLQDEFSVSKVIEDEEARTLMAEAALKSCREDLAQLQQKQERSIEEARAEFKRVEDAREKLESLKCKFFPNQEADDGKPNDKDKSAKAGENPQGLSLEAGLVTQKRQELEEKIKEQFEMGSNESLTVTELAEKIDELVSGVISLETAVSSQTALIDRLKSEVDDLHALIQNLEENKTTLMDGTTNTLTHWLNEMEEKLNRVQDLKRNTEDQNNNLQTHFTEARSSLDCLSEKLHSMTVVEEIEEMESSQKEDEPSVEEKTPKQPSRGDGSGNSRELRGALGHSNEEQVIGTSENNRGEKGKEKDSQRLPNNDDADTISEKQEEPKSSDKVAKHVSWRTADNVVDAEPREEAVETDDKPNSQRPPNNADADTISEKQEEPKSSDKAAKHVSWRTADNVVDVEPREEAVETDDKPNSQRPPNNDDADTISEKQEEPKSSDKAAKHVSWRTADNVVEAELREEAIETDDEPNWEKMFSNGLGDKEKLLLTEYTTVLRNYKDLKKKLSDAENKNRDSTFESTLQLRELRSTIAKRDEEIQSLRQKLSLPQGSAEKNMDSKEDNRSVSNLSDDRNITPEAKESSGTNEGLEVPPPTKKEDAELILTDQPQPISPIEEKIRGDIDALLDKNLDIWLRFSNCFHQVQKFETGFKDLQNEATRLKEKEKLDQEGSAAAAAAATTDIKSDLRPIYKHMREIQTELTVWIEQSASLKDKLKSRFSSLCDIQEEVTKALNAGADEEGGGVMEFRSIEAAKFVGEVLYMKQENNKVTDELHSGLERVRALQNEMEKTLAQLDEEFGMSKNSNQPQLRHAGNRARVPLRSFIFGTKPKKKSSIFSCMHHMHQRKYQELKAAFPM